MTYLSKQFPNADKIELVQDNLNTHQGGSFYAHLPAQEARMLCERLEMNFTPKGASWLNAIEIEFSTLSRQCLNRRIPCQLQLEREILAWLKERNDKRIKLDWQFSIQDARLTLKRHYQKCRKS